MAKQKLEPVLAAVPLFEGLTKRHLKKLASIAEMANFMKGAKVVKEGDPGDSFYVVLVGEAKVSVKGRTVCCPATTSARSPCSTVGSEPRPSPPRPP